MPLATETAIARFSGIEDWSGPELLDAMVEGQFAAIAAVHNARTELVEAVERSVARLRSGGRLIYLGAGTSGRIATQDGAELPPTFNWPEDRAIALMAGGDTAFVAAAEGAEDDGPSAIAALEGHGVGPEDVVIGLAASGRTPFTIAGLAHARKQGALTIGIQNNPGGEVGAVAEIEILLETGAELIAGSTRMKAGTAQKAALNCLSTGIMVGLGFVYKGLMVEMRPTNDKLRARAAEIVVAITGASGSDATAALKTANYSIKHASVMLAKGISLADAEGIIESSGGNLRAALEGRV